MNNAELIETMDYMIENVASRTCEMLYERLSKQQDCISQNEAYRRFGRAKVESLLVSGKVKIKPNGNRYEYNTSDLIKNTLSINIIKQRKNGRKIQSVSENTGSFK